MITIYVKVVLPSGEISELELPLNSDIDQLYARLVAWGSLSTTTGRGEPIAYGFYHRRSESYLSAHVSLIDAGVQDGDLIDVTPWPTVEPPVYAREAARRAGSSRRIRIYIMALVVLVSVGLVGIALAGVIGREPVETLTPTPTVIQANTEETVIDVVTPTRPPTQTVSFTPMTTPLPQPDEKQSSRR